MSQATAAHRSALPEPLSEQPALLRLHAVLLIRGKSRASHYRDVATALCVPPVRIGKRQVAWPAHEIYAITNVLIAGARDDEIRKLVAQLIEARAALMPHLASGRSRP